MATSIQFSIRSLLIAMVLTGVGMAAALPVIRTWGTAVQLHFVVNAGVLAALVGGFTAVRCAARRRIERQAGNVLLRATTQGNRFIQLLHIVLLLLFLAGLMLIAAAEAHTGPASRPPYAKFQWVNVAYLGWMAGWLVTNCWWRTGPGIAEIAENGLIEMGTRFTPYSQFRSIRWNRYFPGTLMLVSRHYQTIQIVIPRWEREHIGQFLEEKGLVASGARGATEGGQAGV